MFKHRTSGMSLAEILVSIMIVVALSLLVGIVVRAMDTIKAQQSNKTIQGAMSEIEDAYTRFVNKGGWIQNTTHIQDIMDNLDAKAKILNGSLAINGYTPGSSIACNNVQAVCYRLKNGAVVAVAPNVNPGGLNPNEGFFGSGASPAYTVAGVTTHGVHIDPDGLFRSGEDNSAATHLFLDALGRTGVVRDGGTVNGVVVDQPNYFNMTK
jgi:hypothetical protein